MKKWCKKFSTLLEYTIMVKFGYRAIADLTCDKIGSHFPIWPPSAVIVTLKSHIKAIIVVR